ncbi:DUF5908 family protein [Cellvibrio sp. OA-2007]|uniref:DUF5908 family protein n=1 Tax=Cellvibrio sp. OA-2007 TaxID=529823 RepID=UPI000AC532FE|nr:DUF5908 family protein [Cellvibrio sp. OA-2007]
MAIEIKQLLIKSNVVDEEESAPVAEREIASASIKQEVMSECRRLILEMLQDKGQR